MMKKLIPSLLIFLLFLAIILSRTIFIEADAPRSPGVADFMVNIEEKNSGFNAREKVFFDKWPTDSDWYQPMVYMPLANILTYWSFLGFGVGLWQLRLPFIILSLIGILFLAKIMIKKTDFLTTLITTVVFSFNFNVFSWNRSSLNENLYLFFIPLALFYYLKSYKDTRYIFLFSLFSFLVFVVKISSLPFILATIIMFAFYLHKTFRADKNFSKFKKAMVFFSAGFIGAFLLWLALLGSTGGFKYILGVYKYYSGTYLVGQINSLSSLFLLPWENANLVIRKLILINPYFVFLVVLALLYIINNYKKITKLQLFCLFIAGIGLLQICFFPRIRVGSFKRYIYIMWPLYSLIGVSFYQLKKNFKRPIALDKLRLLLTAIASFLLSWIILSKGYQTFEEMFAKNLGNIWIFGILSLVFLGALVVNNLPHTIQWVRALLKKRLPKYLALAIYSFFLILCLNFDMRAIIKYFKDPTYSYLTSARQFAEDIDMKEEVIGHEQAFRMVGLTNKVRFMFTSDGYSPSKFLEEVINNEKSRYFVMMVKQHMEEPHDGYTREQIVQIKKKYPRVKVVRVYDPGNYDALVLYDKYPQDDLKESDFDTSDWSSLTKWQYLISEKALNPGFHYYSIVLDWPQRITIRYPRDYYGNYPYEEDVNIVKGNTNEIILKIKLHGKLAEGSLRLTASLPIIKGEAEISLNEVDWIDLTESSLKDGGYDLNIFKGAEKIFLRFKSLRDRGWGAGEFNIWYIAESSDELPVKVDFFDKVSVKVNLFGQKKDFLRLSLSKVQEKIAKIIITSDDRIWVGPADATHPEINFIQKEDRADFLFQPLGIDSIEERVFKIKIWYRNIYNQRQWSEFLLREKQKEV